MAVSGQPPASNDGMRVAALAFGILLLILGVLALLYIALAASSMSSMMSGMMGGMMGGGATSAMVGVAVGPWAIVAILVAAGGVLLIVLGRR